MWKEAADKFYQIFHMGKVYYVSKGVLKAANRQYTAVKNEYEMTIGENAEVEEVIEAEEKLSKIPTMVYHFVKLEELGPHVGGRALIGQWRQPLRIPREMSWTLSGFFFDVIDVQMCWAWCKVSAAS